MKSSPGIIIAVLLLAATVCLLSPSNAHAAVCGPQPKLGNCTQGPPECEGIIRKFHTTGCLQKNGKPLNDGGCQCRGYCGYKCATACVADPECKWNKSKKKCFNAATNQPGKPLRVCAATRSPTQSTPGPTLQPTNQPTLATLQPTNIPILATLQPTNIPTAVPACKRDVLFPEDVINPEEGTYSRTLAISPNGNVILYRNQSWVPANSDPEFPLFVSITHVWVAKRNPNNGKWNVKKVAQYNNVALEHGSVNEDGTHVVFDRVEYDGDDSYSTPESYSLDFFKLQSNGKYKNLKSFDISEDAESSKTVVWMSTNGATVIVSTTTVDSQKQTLTYVRQNNVWKLDKTQSDLFLHSISRDGKTAFAVSNIHNPEFRRIYVLKNKEWIVQAQDVVGAGLPSPKYQGSEYSKFSTDGNVIVLGTNVHLYDFEGGYIPDESGAFVFARSNGNWTQVGPKIGGGNIRDGAFTAISDDLNTIMLTHGNAGQLGVSIIGFKIFKKDGSTWTQHGDIVQSHAWGALMNAKGKRVVTIRPTTVWNC